MYMPWPCACVWVGVTPPLGTVEGPHQCRSARLPATSWLEIILAREWQFSPWNSLWVYAIELPHVGGAFRSMPTSTGCNQAWYQGKPFVEFHSRPFPLKSFRPVIQQLLDVTSTPFGNGHIFQNSPNSSQAIPAIIMARFASVRTYSKRTRGALRISSKNKYIGFAASNF